jgi:hypothetical protein
MSALRSAECRSGEHQYPECRGTVKHTVRLKHQATLQFFGMTFNIGLHLESLIDWPFI